MYQYMFDKDHFYDLRELPVGHWKSSKLQMTKNSIWMHFHEPNSKKMYNSTNPIDFKKPYIPPPRSKKSKTNSSLNSAISSPRYVCDNDNFAITSDNLQIMNEEDAFNNPKPIIPVVGTYGKTVTKNTKIKRTKTDNRTLKDLATIPTTSRTVRTVRSLTPTPDNSNHPSVRNKAKSAKKPKPNYDGKMYFSLKKEDDSSQNETEASNLNTASSKSELNSNLSNLTVKERNGGNLNMNEIEQNIEQIIFVHSSQEDREAAHAKKTLQILERKEKKFIQPIPCFSVFGDSTVIGNSADIDANIETKKAVIFTDELPDPPLYIDKRYGDDGHKNPLRISQIEIRKQFKEALENGQFDDYDNEDEFDVEEESVNENANVRNRSYALSRPTTAKRMRNRVRFSPRSRSSSVTARRNLYKTRMDYRNDADKDEDAPMVTRKQYFNSASKIPNIGSYAYDM